MRLTFAQHALVVFVVLGLGMASALWLPNVEFTFGLTGATASVLISYIIPALCFLRLYNKAPELGGAGSAGECAVLQSCDYCSFMLVLGGAAPFGFVNGMTDVPSYQEPQRVC